MTEAAGERPDPAAEGAWLAVSDALLRGVGHAMNNRAAALSAVVQVLGSSGAEGPLEGALRSETERLQRVVELLKLLPRRWDSEPEPVLVEDLMPNAIELLTLHADLPETRYYWRAEQPLPPVLVEPSLLTHVLCMLGIAAAREAALTGSRTVAFRGSSSGDVVRVEITVGDGNDPYAMPGGRAEGSGMEPVEALLARAGGSFRMETEDGLRMTFSLPTLAEARRRAG